MKPNKSIDWRLVGNLVVVGFSLVTMSLTSAQAIVRSDWSYGILAAGWAMVAVVNVWIAISRMIQRSRDDH